MDPARQNNLDKWMPVLGPAILVWVLCVVGFSIRFLPDGWRPAVVVGWVVLAGLSGLWRFAGAHDEAEDR